MLKFNNPLCLQVLLRIFYIAGGYYFLSHRSLEAIACITGYISSNAIVFAKIFVLLSTEEILSSINFNYKSSMLAFRGSQKLHIFEFVPSLHKNFNILYQCLFCQQ